MCIFQFLYSLNSPSEKWLVHQALTAKIAGSNPTEGAPFIQAAEMGSWVLQEPGEGRAARRDDDHVVLYRAGG